MQAILPTTNGYNIVDMGGNGITQVMDVGGMTAIVGPNAPATFIFLSRFLAAIKTRSNPAYAFLHPISIIILLYLIVLSSMRKSRGTLTWRGRLIS